MRKSAVSMWLGVIPWHGFCLFFFFSPQSLFPIVNSRSEDPSDGRDGSPLTSTSSPRLLSPCHGEIVSSQSFGKRKRWPRCSVILAARLLAGEGFGSGSRISPEAPAAGKGADSSRHTPAASRADSRLRRVSSAGCPCLSPAVPPQVWLLSSVLRLLTW